MSTVPGTRHTAHGTRHTAHGTLENGITAQRHQSKIPVNGGSVDHDQEAYVCRKRASVSKIGKLYNNK